MKRILIFTLLLFLSATMSFAQSIKVSGTVKDSEGNPMPGVYVLDKQSKTKGTATDTDGKYEITVSKNGFLEFSCLGFESKLEQVNGRVKIDVVMKSDAAKLDDVVVIAYGTAKKSDLTGAVSVVDMKSLNDIPAASVSSALQGRVAGMDMMSSTGEPGAEASIQIRGARSISAGNAPLIVVDGVIDAVSDLNEINPADIKSISVLKDVSSTSLYGSRGANGVILITTER
jgi:outer membrane cobalamin receptor protein